MDLSETVKESCTSVDAQLELAWWVEILTQKPKCTYFFGPFASAKEAGFAVPGYFENLEQKAAQRIAIVSKRYQPKELTIFED